MKQTATKKKPQSSKKALQVTAPKPDPVFIPSNDPPKVAEEIPRKSPNGDPFDTMYARLRRLFP